MVARWLFILVIFFLTDGYSWAQAVSHEGAGTAGLNFLKIGVGGRPTGMGEAFVGVSDDATALYWNPAGLYGLSSPEAVAMHDEWFQGIRYEYLGYIQPLGDLLPAVGGVAGVSAAGLYHEPIALTTDGESSSEDFEAYDIALSFSYGRGLSDLQEVLGGASVGLNLKLLYERIYTYSAIGIGLDIGGRYDFSKTPWYESLPAGKEFIPESFGLSVANVGYTGPMKPGGKPINMPTIIRLGTSYKFLDDSLTVAADLAIPLDNYPRLSIGAEYWIEKIIGLRMGYITTYGTDVGSVGLPPNLRAGLGFRWGQFEFDYSLAPYGLLSQESFVGMVHRISVSFRLSGFVEEKKGEAGPPEEGERRPTLPATPPVGAGPALDRAAEALARGAVPALPSPPPITAQPPITSAVQEAAGREGEEARLGADEALARGAQSEDVAVASSRGVPSPASPKIPTPQATEARAQEANEAIDLASAEARAAAQEAAAGTESEASALSSASLAPPSISSLPSDRGDVVSQEAARGAAESAGIEAERETQDLSTIGRAEAAGKGSTLNLAPPPSPREPASAEAMRNLSQGSSQMGANEAGAARRARPALPGMPSGENSRSETPEDPGSLVAGGLIQELTAADEHYNAGVRLFRAGSMDEAIAEYRKAVELDPTHAFAYTQLGIALYRKGEIDGAVSALESAHELNPESEVLKQLIERLKRR